MFERTIDLPYPLSDSRVLLTLVRTDLAAHPLGSMVEGARVSAKPADGRRVQQSLFVPDLPSPKKLVVTLARLTGLVGPSASARRRFRIRTGREPRLSRHFGLH